MNVACELWNGIAARYVRRPKLSKTELYKLETCFIDINM